MSLPENSALIYGNYDMALTQISEVFTIQNEKEILQLRFQCMEKLWKCNKMLKAHNVKMYISLVNLCIQTQQILH